MNLDSTPILVTVRCTAYNQVPYIRQCLEGFVIQRTNFRYEVIVHDDASTDGTADVIREYAQKYPDIIKPIIEKENQYSKGGFSLINKIMSNNFSYGKYIADCEGDDYWIDPLKLQKQVDVLEKNPSVTCVHTGFITVDKDGKEITRPYYEECMRKSHNGNVITALLNGNYVMTLTAMYRSEVFTSPIYLSCPAKYDYATSFAAAMMGDFIYLPDKTACYRQTPGGSMDSMHSDPNHPLVKMRKEVYSYFSKLIIENKSVSFKEKAIQRCHILIHLMRINDYETMKSILEIDFLSKVIYPFAYIYKKAKYANK